MKHCIDYICPRCGDMYSCAGKCFCGERLIKIATWKLMQENTRRVVKMVETAIEGRE